MTENNTKSSVLLIDDDKFLVDMYCMKFTSQGYKVSACLSASDALKMLREGLEPDAILFDLVMPEHDGYYFLKTLSSEKLAKSARLIALTNESDYTAKSKAEELGANRVIVKASMIPSEVVKLVDSEIAAKRKA